MQAVAFTNRKGGVGKSSCVMHLGVRLAQLGHRTLLVDVDPQASLSQGFLGRDALDLDPAHTLAGIYDHPGIGLADVAVAGVRANLSLVVGHERMDHFNSPDPWDSGRDQFRLRDALAEVEGDYDLCLLDCPPTVNLCGWSALVAAGAVVIPAQLEDFGIQGVSAIRATIAQIRAGANPALRLLGILPSMVNRRLAIHRTYEADARAVFEGDVFAAVVPAAADYKVAVTLRQGVTEYKPRSAASRAIEAVAGEILDRLAIAAVATKGVA